MPMTEPLLGRERWSGRCFLRTEKFEPTTALAERLVQDAARVEQVMANDDSAFLGS